MKFKKIVGILIICLSLLTISLTIMLAQVSMYLDKLSKDGYWNDIFEYISFFSIILILVSFFLGVYLIDSKE